MRSIFDGLLNKHVFVTKRQSGIPLSTKTTGLRTDIAGRLEMFDDKHYELRITHEGTGSSVLVRGNVDEVVFASYGSEIVAG